MTHLRPTTLFAAAGLTLAALTSAAAAVKPVHSLHLFQGPDGAAPVAGLIDVHGTLYGTTSVGGAQNMGTVFAFDPKTRTETVLYSFTGPDGAEPEAELLESGGELYGTTVLGGANDRGTIFRLDPATGIETVLYSFRPGNDGSFPRARLTKVGQKLFGTTNGGGSRNCGGERCGTVFAFNLKTGKEKVLHRFDKTDGSHPLAGLTLFAGLLYSTTASDGPNLTGTIFTIDPATGAQQTQYAFGGFGSGDSEGGGDLIVVGGTLFGTAAGGGMYGRGTVFSFDPATGIERVLHSFAGGNDGEYPYAGLTNVAGILYGVTEESGGFDSLGTVFSFDPSTGTETVRYTFRRSSYEPAARLLLAGKYLFGTTARGNSGNSGTACSPNCGSIFRVTP